MLDRQHLQTIREVNRLGSVTAAAKALNLSQSAVSHSMAKLQQHFAVDIWHRKGRTLKLTQAGKYLLSIAERIVPEFEHAEQILADFSAGRRGTLRVGMECHPCEKWLMSVIQPYLTTWTEVNIEVRTGFRFDGIAALQAHEIDLLLTPDPIASNDVVFEPVFDYDLLLVVPIEHPLSTREFIHPEDLASEVLLTVPVSPERLDIYTRFLAPAQCRPRQHVTVETTEMMMQLVSARRGVSVLPDWLIRQEGIDLSIRAVRIGEKGLQKSIHIGLRTEDAGIDYLRGFIELGRQQQPISMHPVR